MKSLNKYLSELIIQEAGTDSVNVTDLEIKYMAPTDIYVEVPKSYSESDLQIYLDDKFLNSLPGGKDTNPDKQFGKANADNISDAHFEYARIMPVSSVDDGIRNDEGVYFPWDTSYDKTLGTDVELRTMNIKNLIYILLFNKFELKFVTEETFSDKLNEIIAASINELKNGNKLPFDITYNPSDVSFS